MPAPAEIAQLVELFQRNVDQYRSPAFSEAAARHQFIDPFFAALGWDVNNTQGFAEQYKEVVHEDKVHVGGATKAPDYSFRIGKERKFFVEAKKPSVNIKHDIEPAYQLRRYAWSAKLPLSILTDFEEFSVYDCRTRPDKNDKAATGRILLLNYTDYVARWDEIAAIFSKAAVWQGALDKFAEAKAGKRGTAEVDDEFLAEIERWRELLARNLVLRNPTLHGREVNWAVQQTIDRIVFLRICEARDLETFEQLRALLNGGQTYARLRELFRRADMRYNSGLFHFNEERGRAEPPDTLTPGLEIDDKVLKDIIEHLYYPQSPYEFSVLPADILGHVYERFLGKVIRLIPRQGSGQAPGRQVKIEEKPEVRKAGGVYYTPTYIVDYIVRQTVGPLLAGQRAGAAGRAPTRILDPACGSGSFLLGAYQFLLDWHLAEYLKDADRWLKGKRPPLERVRGGITRLTIEERKRILMDHIFGVDIDPQAVEVTKLSLLLKVLEGEGVAGQLSLGVERVLPDLGRNIKCGNSLIGPDFYAGRLDLPDEDTGRRVNAFDWNQEFPDVMAAGGFDAVIGNPPYIRIQALQEWAPLEVQHYKRAYRAASKGNYDIYVVFVEKGLGLLNAHGRLGFILPHKFFNAQYGEPLRTLLAAGRHLNKVVHFGDQQVFEGATTYTCLLFLEKGGCQEFQFVRAHDLPAWRAGAAQVEGAIPAASAGTREWNFVVGRGSDLFERLRAMPVHLVDVASRMYQGPITSADTVYLFKDFTVLTAGFTEVFSVELNERVQLETAILKRVVRSGSISRYHATPTAVVFFPYKVKDNTAELYSVQEMQRGFPLAWSYLIRNRRLLEEREKGKFRDSTWYRFGRTQNLGMWERPKLMLPYMIARLAVYPDRTDGYYFINVTTGGYGLLPDEKYVNLDYLCGLLNSRLLDFYLKRVSTTFHGGYFAANKQYIEQLPIRTIDFAVPADVARHDRMVALVTQMLDLHQRLAAAAIPHEKALLQRRIETTDRQIDALVYELYGLSDAEIAVVEGTG